MQVGLIGCGVMGSAFARKIGKRLKWTLFSRTLKKAEQLAKDLDGKVASSMEEVAKECDVVIIAVPPANIDLVADGISAIDKDKLVISLVGGVRLDVWKDLLPDVTICRILPNLPILYGEGVVGIVDEVDSIQRQTIEKLVEGMGLIQWLSEEKLEALSALAGSGCGFAYLILEAYTEAGIMMGLQPKEALGMACQTLKGAAIMCQETGEHPAKLKWDVAAPGVTTIGGLVDMEGSGVRSGIIEGILETRMRADLH